MSEPVDEYLPELYLAKQPFPDSAQITASNKVLKHVEDSGLQNSVKLIEVFDPEAHLDYLRTVLPRGTERFPIIVTVHAGSTGAVLGHSGLDDVLDAIQRMSPVPKPKDK